MNGGVQHLPVAQRTSNTDSKSAIGSDQRPVLQSEFCTRAHHRRLQKCLHGCQFSHLQCRHALRNQPHALRGIAETLNPKPQPQPHCMLDVYWTDTPPCCCTTLLSVFFLLIVLRLDRFFSGFVQCIMVNRESSGDISKYVYI